MFIFHHLKLATLLFFNRSRDVLQNTINQSSTMLKALLLISIYLSLSACNFTSLDQAQPGLYAGDPSLTKLSSNVAASSLFESAPSPIAKQLDLFSHSASTDSYYSHYQIRPLQTQATRTYYQTTETVRDGGGFSHMLAQKEVIVHGQGISYGGIYWPLEKMVVYDSEGNIVYYNKIAITIMKPLSGHLFPLQVGNHLKFYFTRFHKRMMNGRLQNTIEHGVMEYNVIAKHQHVKTTNGQIIPGDVFTLNVIESTNLHPRPYFTDQYDYAPYLGWYINDHYYDTNNHPTAHYLIKHWQ